MGGVVITVDCAGFVKVVVDFIQDHMGGWVDDRAVMTVSASSCNAADAVALG